MVLANSVPAFENQMRRALSEYSLVVVDYFAPWCHACRSLYPKLRQIASANPDVLFVKVRLASVAYFCPLSLSCRHQPLFSLRSACSPDAQCSPHA